MRGLGGLDGFGGPGAMVLHPCPGMTGPDPGPGWHLLIRPEYGWVVSKESMYKCTERAAKTHHLLISCQACAPVNYFVETPFW